MKKLRWRGYIPIIFVLALVGSHPCAGTSQLLAQSQTDEPHTQGEGGGDAWLLPPVAVHVSEATKAHWRDLGGPHKAWKYWHVWGFLLEAFKGDGTPVTIISDAAIERGGLLIDRKAKFPIVISLASACMSDATAQQMDRYVRAGGHLYLGSTAGTRDQFGKLRMRHGQACFALRSLDLIPGDAKLIGTAKKVADDPLVANFRWAGVVNWLLPRSANSIGYAHPVHWIQSVEPGVVRVLLESDKQPILCTTPLGQGRIIYHSEFCPLAGYSGYVVDNVEYSFFRNAINQAYRAHKLPLVRRASWPYPAVAAFKTRHDHYLHKAASDLEAAHGIRGEWLLRTNSAIGVGDWPHLEAIVKSGALIGSHTLNEYTLDSGGFEVGRENVRQSLDALAGHLGRRPRIFVAPGMMAVRDSSVRALVENGLVTTGDMSHGPFPSFALKIQTADDYGPQAHWPILEIPVSRLPAPPKSAWRNLIYSHMEDMRLEVIQETVDLSYALGGVINIYDHVGDPTQGIRARWPHPTLEHFTFYLKYGLRMPYVWKTDPLKLLDWWKARSACELDDSRLTRQAGRLTLAIGVKRKGPALLAFDVQLPTNARVVSVTGKNGEEVETLRVGSLLKIKAPASGGANIELETR